MGRLAGKVDLICPWQQRSLEHSVGRCEAAGRTETLTRLFQRHLIPNQVAESHLIPNQLAEISRDSCDQKSSQGPQALCSSEKIGSPSCKSSKGSLSTQPLSLAPSWPQHGCRLAVSITSVWRKCANQAANIWQRENLGIWGFRMNPMTGIVMDSNLYILLYLFHPFSAFSAWVMLWRFASASKLLSRIVMVSWYLHVSAYYLHVSKGMHRYGFSFVHLSRTLSSPLRPRNWPSWRPTLTMQLNCRVSRHSRWTMKASTLILLKQDATKASCRTSTC